MSSLASAFNALSRARQTEQERRRFRRLEMSLGARFLDKSGQEHDCRTIDLSPGDAFIASSAAVRIGDTIVAYIDQIGRIAGTVIRVSGQGFALLFDASPQKRERLAETLTALINEAKALLNETRRSTRHTGGGEARLMFDDGTEMYAEIADFSLVGIAVKTTQPRPLIGTWVQVGAAYGRVARYFETGFAIDFETRAR